jgi:Spy/CpxP family protein refolding chaperone
MKTKFWMVALTLVVLAVCGTALLSYAQDAPGAPTAGWHGHGQHHMGWMAKQLNLTDAQKTQIKSIMQAQRTTMRPVMQQMAQNRIAMLSATSNGAFDQAKVTVLANRQAQLIAQMMVQKQSIQHLIYTQVLTPEQRATADQLRQKQIAHINQRLEKWSQPGTESPAE